MNLNYDEKQKIIKIAISTILFITIFFVFYKFYYNNVSLSNEIEILKEDNDFLTNNITTLKNEHEENIKEYENDITDLQTQITELESTISEIENYRDTYKELENKYNDLNTKYKDLDTKYNDINSNYKTLQSQNESLKEQVQNYLEQLNNINKSNTYSYNYSTTNEDNYEVYITRTGSKYHNGSCSYLRQSKIAISKSDAIAQGYTPCSRCNP